MKFLGKIRTFFFGQIDQLLRFYEQSKYVVVDYVPFEVYGSYFRVSFPQIQQKFYKHVNNWNVATTNIKRQEI